MLLPSPLSVGDKLTATRLDAIIAALGGDNFTGTPLFGTYSASKLMQHARGRATGTSAASTGYVTVSTPSGCTAILDAITGMYLITGQTILVRTDLITTAGTVVFQLRNAASPYAALPSTSYDFAYDIAYQV